MTRVKAEVTRATPARRVAATPGTRHGAATRERKVWNGKEQSKNRALMPWRMTTRTESTMGWSCAMCCCNAEADRRGWPVRPDEKSLYNEYMHVMSLWTNRTGPVPYYYY